MTNHVLKEIHDLAVDSMQKAGKMTKKEITEMAFLLTTNMLAIQSICEGALLMEKKDEPK